tara:strand:- start:11077 stop:12138 length:1062 start_codon:yes stop_codon:yes gene_type:complete
MKTPSQFLLIFFLLILSFNSYLYASDINTIHALIETPQVKIDGDADDPAIWINKADIKNSIVFGTDKYNGIYSYNLDGNILGFSKSGNMNNIDLRSFDNKTYIFATDTSNNTINLWVYKDIDLNKASKEGKFALRETPDFSGNTNFLAYGACAGISQTNGLIVFVTEAKGSGVQLWNFNGKKLDLLRTFNNSDAYESEGCVFDDENNLLFISEENKKGVLRSYELTDALTLDDEFIIDDRNGYITGDPEGLAILKQKNNNGYLIASSQGNSSFNVYQRNRPHKYITSFKISGNQYIDGASNTDGIEIVNMYLNENFPDGIMIVHDGKNTGEKTISKENFKFISLKDIKSLLPY